MTLTQKLAEIKANWNQIVRLTNPILKEHEEMIDEIPGLLAVIEVMSEALEFVSSACDIPEGAIGLITRQEVGVRGSEALAKAEEILNG